MIILSFVRNLEGNFLAGNLKEVTGPDYFYLYVYCSKNFDVIVMILPTRELNDNHLTGSIPTNLTVQSVL